LTFGFVPFLCRRPSYRGSRRSSNGCPATKLSKSKLAQLTLTRSVAYLAADRRIHGPEIPLPLAEIDRAVFALMGSPVPSDGGPTGSRAAMVEQMRRIVRSVQASLADSAMRADLNERDFQALVRIVSGDGLNGAEIGRILGMTSSSITELADRLQNARMITRTRSPSDRRLVVLKPTARGRRVIDRALGPTLTAMVTVLEGLDDIELGVVGDFLDQVEHQLLELPDR
jgi:DNA-binding MarR family transcriptional regulator